MTLVSEHIGQLFCDGHRIEYTEFGGGDRWVVLVPSRLVPRRMHQPLARKLAGSGAHVVTLDPLGHGRSDRPGDPLLYSTRAFAEQVIALLDHVGAERAVLGGTALGANVALEAAVIAPDRVRGLLLETPLLENAVTSMLLTSTPLLLGARFAPLTVSGVRALSRLVPRGVVPFWAGVGLDALDQRPEAVAAMLHGLLYSSLGPSSSERAGVDVPALVIGRRGDPLHPVADAEMLAEELTGSAYVTAGSRWDPRAWTDRADRTDDLVQAFVEQCFENNRTGRLLGASS